MPKHSALSHRQQCMLREAIVTLRNRCIQHLRHGMTAKDLFEAFIREADKKPILTVMKICSVNVEHQAMPYSVSLKEIEANGVVVDVDATFELSLKGHGEFKFLFPKYLMEDAKLMQASPNFEETLRLMASIHFEWAQVYQVLSHLYEQCERVAQIQTICPAFGNLLAEVKETQEWGEKVKNMRPNHDVPRISYEARKLAPKLTRTVAKAMVIPLEDEKPEDEVQVRLLSSRTSTQKWRNQVWAMAV